MTDIVIVQPDEQEIRQEYSPVVRRANDLAVLDKDSHEDASLLLVDIRRAKKAVGERLDPVIKHAHKAHRGLTTLRNDLLAPLEIADGIVTARLNSYESEQRLIAQKVQAAAQAEAAKLEDERRLMEAIAAEEAGEDADAVLEEPIEAPTIHVEPEIAKVSGVSSRTTYKAEVMDLVLLLEYVVQNPQWMNLVIPNTVALNGLARSQRGSLKIPGVRVVEDTVRSVRTA